MDEIPKEYEEALVDGYTGSRPSSRSSFPEATTSIAATAVFCSSPLERYAFALMMTNRRRRRRRPSSRRRSDAADRLDHDRGSLLFLLPMTIFAFALHGHLLRGVTFGAIRKWRTTMTFKR